MYTDYTIEKEKILIDTIVKMKQSIKVFPNYINKIIFPLYKNLEENTSIEFNFPLTVLVGANGTNKSSVLRALQGSVEGISLGNFWFSTSMDPIKESGTDNRRNCFFYEYVDANDNYSLKEVLKQRAPRKGDPDYWETARPVQKYGMKKLSEGVERNPAVKKDVLYLDFRSELSAFDKCFYMGLNGYTKMVDKKKYMRGQSKKLKTVITDNKIMRMKNNTPQNELPIQLTEEELKCISFVLGKNYNSGTLIKHKFFEDWGYSVVLNQETFNYSEAMAGSGEIAAVRIVHELLNTKEESLILLDEPEVSLHPGAQARIKYLILELIKKKKIQVIISTHSTIFVENLPKNAIKKFELDPSIQKINIKNTCLFYEAFYSLGQRILNTENVIHVEDKLAKKIVEVIMKDVHSKLLDDWNVIYSPGGESAIKNSSIPVYSSKNATNTYVIFDGDQNPNYLFKDIKDFSARELDSEFDDIIKQITGTTINFITDGQNGNGRCDQKLNLQTKYYNFYKEKVFYLPLSIPEDIIWNEEFIRLNVDNEEKMDKIMSKGNSKARIFEASKIIFGREDNIESLEDMLITKWAKSKSVEKEQIKEIINQILEQSNMLMNT
ncbi:AAA family ATPase [Lysinibacillus fusiformis]|uniref:AAA family ATPase n=1 Tax=Lysinibacillus fusiformis TaxID=28031 RepID=UPI0020BFB26A|nr:AAA family ATPase [Lysinibacillus fusiformis]